MRGAAHRALASSKTAVPVTTHLKQLSAQRRMPGPASEVPQADAAWALWRRLGSPKYHVAPMVDQVRHLAPAGQFSTPCWDERTDGRRMLACAPHVRVAVYG